MRPAAFLVASAVLALLMPDSVVTQQRVVYRVPVSGEIELGLAPYIARALREADTARAAAVILELETPGGRVDAALRIVKAVTESRIPVYAFVNVHAWSAGAMIALAADSIFMVPGSSIGAATPIVGGSKASEKIVSAMRGEFRALAERRGIDPRIAEAMVDEEIAIVGVVDSGKLLTLTSNEALELGIASAEIDGYEMLLDQLGLSGVQTVQPGFNWAELLVRFLSQALVSSLLLTIGTLGLLIEIKTPSFGIAGTIGLIALGAFFGSNLIIGLAGWEEVILLGVGVVALGIEVFLVPGFGIAGIVALLCIGSAIFLALVGNLHTVADIGRASMILTIAIVLVAGATYTIVRQLPTTRRARGIFLGAALGKGSGFVAAEVRDELVGLEGVAVTDLRPSGTAVVGNERLDVVCESGFVDKGARVRIVRSEGYRHVVLPIDDDVVA